MTKVARIAFNSAEWRHPTGDASESESDGTYNKLNGYGHEDWLFRSEWTIGNWRYAFLQGVNKSRAKLIRENQSFDVKLFTIQPNKTRRYIAIIQNVECLNDALAIDALEAFKERGWFNQMKTEIKRIGGDHDALGNTKWAEHILNVRFKLSDIEMCSPTALIDLPDPAALWNRYVLYDATKAAEKNVKHGGRIGSEQPPNEDSYKRKGTSDTDVSLEHAKMQTILMAELKSEFPAAQVLREENFVDVLVKTSKELRLYEIKSDLSPLTVIRLAIGQLIEYAYNYLTTDERDIHLTIVGRNPLSKSEAEYLFFLKGRLSFAIEYRVVNI